MAWSGSSQRPHQKVKHPVHPLAVVHAERKLVEITLHVLGADVHVGRTDRRLKQPPEALDRVGVEREALADVASASMLRAS